jgi:hypothetical protein
MTNENVRFYRDLERQEVPLRELLKARNLFVEVPTDWHVLFTEIKEPLGIVNKESFSDINLVATGSIITVLNAIKLKDKNIELPYFFRGDGATFMVPESVLELILEALDNYRVHVQKNLNLDLRVGNIKIEDVYNAGVNIRIAKLNLNKYLITPVILGNGLKFAEREIKKSFNEHSIKMDKEAVINLYGMECRWDEILPNKDDKKIVCLLVWCKEESMQVEVFTKIMDEIDFVFGDLNTRTPITMVKLKLDNSFRKMRKEMYVRLGKFDRSYLIQNWLITYIGKYYFKFSREGKKYLFKVTQLSDTIMLDGSINTVFSGTQKQINKLKLLLDALEADKKIVFGLHSTYASIMSCYIEDREENHIHFVDGTEGGYSCAAAAIINKLDISNEAFWSY